jgi:hypothetical protein
LYKEAVTKTYASNQRNILLIVTSKRHWGLSVGEPAEENGYDRSSLWNFAGRQTSLLMGVGTPINILENIPELTCLTVWCLLVMPETECCYC